MSDIESPLAPLMRTLRVMRTLRRTDGEELFDEWSHWIGTATDDPWHVADEDAERHTSSYDDDPEEAIPYVLETWRLVASEERSILPSEAAARLA